MATARFTWWKELRLLGKFVQLEFSSGTMRARRVCEVYDFLLLTERTRYLNFGYWAGGCETYDDACEAMVDLLGKAAELGPGDRVLDAGFGYGDQDFRWLATTEVAEIIGINITPLQIREARSQARLRGLTERVRFLAGSATDLPFPSASFDKVLSLESPIQFVPRQAFLEQTYRVLRPGGLFAATEILPLAARDGESPAAARRGWERDSWFNATPKDNWHSANEYRERLANIGFTDISIQSIRDDVWEPWRRHMATLVEDPAFKERFSRLVYRPFRKGLLGGAGGGAAGQPMAQADYVVVVARRPS
jgi:erythromycin 3''-O-methyltransferase